MLSCNFMSDAIYQAYSRAWSYGNTSTCSLLCVRLPSFCYPEGNLGRNQLPSASSPPLHLLNMSPIYMFSSAVSSTSGSGSGSGFGPGLALRWRTVDEPFSHVTCGHGCYQGVTLPHICTCHSSRNHARGTLSFAISMAIPCPVSYCNRSGFDVILTHIGFWQYGLIDRELFYGCVRTIIFSEDDWAVFEYDECVPERRGALCPPNRELPYPGTYILLRPGLSNGCHS